MPTVTAESPLRYAIYQGATLLGHIVGRGIQPDSRGLMHEVWEVESTMGNLLSRHYSYHQAVIWVHDRWET